MTLTYKHLEKKLCKIMYKHVSKKTKNNVKKC